MEIVEGILDSLADGGESIIQISQYLEFLGIKLDRKQLFNYIQELLRQGKIFIEYPPQSENTKVVDLSNIEDYWFNMTEEGRRDWDSIEN